NRLKDSTTLDLQRTALFLFSAAIKPEEGETEPYAHHGEISAIADDAKSKISAAYSDQEGVVNGAISCAESCALRRPDLAPAIALRLVRFALTTENLSERTGSVDALKEIMNAHANIADTVLKEIDHRTKHTSTATNNPEVLKTILCAVAKIEGRYDHKAMETAKNMASNSNSADQMTAALDVATTILRDTKDAKRREKLMPCALLVFDSAAHFAYGKSIAVPAYPNRIKYLLDTSDILPDYALPKIAEGLTLYRTAHPSNEAQAAIERICTQSADKVCKSARWNVMNTYKPALTVLFPREQLLDSLANDSFSVPFRNSLLTDDLFKQCIDIAVDWTQGTPEGKLARNIVRLASKSSKKHAVQALQNGLDILDKKEGHNVATEQAAFMIYTSLSAFPSLANRIIVAKMEELTQHNHEATRGWATRALRTLQEGRRGLFRKAGQQVTMPDQADNKPDASAPLRGITAQLHTVREAYREQQVLARK
ncbi:MAG: hypothetical protein PHW63_09360, partial [Alphaproteobacteria bacterium]|nr:hypothetical protein [Alphaproteobacteria bacterium]